MTRRRTWGLIGVAAVLWLVIHHTHAYRPRIRPAIPDPRSGTAALLDSPDATFSFWMPYPHQNLPRLREELGLDAEALDAIMALTGMPQADLPSFGALALPAAEELGFAVGRENRGRILAAQIYPALAVFARLAGKLADNPWLAGGPIDIDGAAGWVSWDHNRWILVDHAGPEPHAGPGRPSSTTPALAILALHEASESVPADDYLLIEESSGFSFISQAGDPPPIPWLRHPSLAANDVALVLVERSPEIVGDRILIFFAQPAGQLQELPRTVSVTTGAQKHWSLPGESLLGLSGRDPAIAFLPDGQMAALDNVSLEQGRRLLPHLLNSGLASDDVHVLWIDLATTAREAERIAAMLERIPLIARQKVDQWRTIATVCRPLAARFVRLTVVIDRQQPALRLHLERRSPVIRPVRE